MILTKNRIQFTAETKVLDTFNVDNDIIKNSVIIPFRTQERFNITNRATYNNLIIDRPELEKNNFLNVLIIEAQEGYKIYNYENYYTYYIATAVDLDGGKTEIIKKDITELVSEEEKEYIQRCIWTHRDTLPVAKLQVEDALKIFDSEDDFILFSHWTNGNDYKGTWKSSKYSGSVLITIENYKQGILEINIDDGRFIR